MTTRTLGQEWVSPGNQYWESGAEGQRPVPFGGAVAVQTNAGWLLLVKVEEIIDGPECGKIRRVYVKASELNTGERPANW